MRTLSHHQVVVELFQRHFAGRKEISGIEIGTQCGDLTRQILWSLPQAQLYTIDPWEHRDKAEFEAGEPQEYHDNNRQFAEERLWAPEFKDRVVVLAMRSADAQPWIVERNPGKKFDFVWIDGDHSEQGIVTDLDLYESLVAEGGILGGHDCGLAHPLTEIILKRFDRSLNTGNDYTWYVFK